MTKQLLFNTKSIDTDVNLRAGRKVGIQSHSHYFGGTSLAFRELRCNRRGYCLIIGHDHVRDPSKGAFSALTRTDMSFIDILFERKRTVSGKRTNVSFAPF